MKRKKKQNNFVAPDFVSSNNNNDHDGDGDIASTKKKKQFSSSSNAECGEARDTFRSLKPKKDEKEGDESHHVAFGVSSSATRSDLVNFAHIFGRAHRRHATLVLAATLSPRTNGWMADIKSSRNKLNDSIHLVRLLLPQSHPYALGAHICEHPNGICWLLCRISMENYYYIFWNHLSVRDSVWWCNVVHGILIAFAMKFHWTTAVYAELCLMLQRPSFLSLHKKCGICFRVRVCFPYTYTLVPQPMANLKINFRLVPRFTDFTLCIGHIVCLFRLSSARQSTLSIQQMPDFSIPTSLILRFCMSRIDSHAIYSC